MKRFFVVLSVMCFLLSAPLFGQDVVVESESEVDGEEVPAIDDSFSSQDSVNEEGL